MKPTVSVILPVYNCPDYVGEAVQSILDQSFRDFELILIDDGSTDSTPEVLAGFTDPRIKLIHQSNQGLPAALNRGIASSSGKYIARQDQDDVSLADRFLMQVEFLDDHPDYAVVGTWTRILEGRQDSGRMHRHPTEHATLAFELLFDSRFVHSSVMIRRSALDVVGMYSTDLAVRGPEDYELWTRIVRSYRVGNLPEVLHLYREIPGSMSRSGGQVFVDRVVAISTRQIAWAADVDPANTAVGDIAALAHLAFRHLSEKPDFAGMREVLIRAAIRVAGKERRLDATKAAVDRFDELYRRYNEHFSSDLRRKFYRHMRQRLRAFVNSLRNT